MLAIEGNTRNISECTCEKKQIVDDKVGDGFAKFPFVACMLMISKRICSLDHCMPMHAFSHFGSCLCQGNIYIYIYLFVSTYSDDLQHLKPHQVPKSQTWPCNIF